MKIEFTNNAVGRMQDRSIAEADIQAVLDAPDHLGPCFEKHWHARKKVNARTLEVLFSRHRAFSRVITAYWQDAAP
ncbi:MAG TPA: DUF4258 domain-containing protein [Candidatus Methylomirabilis sp.]|nr:DUF4258 domain-containing protein [Candidatus Methylomirabilis sp.]